MVLSDIDIFLQVIDGDLWTLVCLRLMIPVVGSIILLLSELLQMIHETSELLRRLEVVINLVFNILLQLILRLT